MRDVEVGAAAPVGSPTGGAEPQPRWWWDLAFAAVLALIALAARLLPAVMQDPAYHLFADRRLLWHVPNALDVLSNGAFALVGAAGLRAALRPGTFPDRRARGAWVVLFAAVLATSVGSAWYHLAPSSGRLVWDRLPMAAGFTALVAALAGERFGAAVSRWLLPRLVAVGVASVVWWWLGDGAGRGNLLPYLAVQLGALASIPLLLAGRRRSVGSRAPWLVALGLYVIAKVLEDADGAVYAALGVSGHTLKHLVAAGAIGVLALEVLRRGRRHRAAATPGAATGGARPSTLEKSLGGT